MANIFYDFGGPESGNHEDDDTDMKKVDGAGGEDDEQDARGGAGAKGPDSEK